MLCGLLAGGLAEPARAQSAASAVRVAGTEENLRSTPGGARIGTVLAAASLTAGALNGPWREVTLEGWVPAGSLRRTDRVDYPVAIATGGGAIHDAPDGAVVARGLPGLLLGELARQDGWVRVRRTAWIWSESLAAASARVPAAAGKPSPPPATAGGAAAKPPLPSTTAARPGAPGAGASSTAGAPAAVPPAPGAISTPATPTAVLSTPRGDTLAVLSATAGLQVLARDGEWTKVRLEGWTREPVAGQSADGAARRMVTPAMLRENPDAFRGQTVVWTAEFVAVQRADSLRTDFTPGEPYMLLRDPNGEPGFAYVAVAPAHLAAIRRLAPLQKLHFVARVRAGRSAVMGHPVLDLVELRR